MAEISSITLPDGTTITMKDAEARRIDLSGYASKNNPAFTGDVKLGNTSMTENQLKNLLELESANGVSF